MKQRAALFIIVLALAAWASLLVFWILFWVDRARLLKRLAAQIPAAVIGVDTSVFSLVVGLVLLGLLLAGVNGLIVWVARQYSMNKLTRDFVSMISHDLRSPLATIKLYLETMQLRELDRDKQQQFVETMLFEVDRLSTLIETILDVSRMERRKYPISLTPLNLREVITKYLAETEAIIAEQQRRLISETMEQLTIEGDEQALRKCLDNLVSNAAKYSYPNGNIFVSLVRSGKYACIQVRDEGEGFSRREQRNLFQRFYRGASGRRLNKMGSGLGLYIVKEIVRLHHGRVTAQSLGTGKGSTFQIFIPTTLTGCEKGGDSEQDIADRG